MIIPSILTNITILSKQSNLILQMVWYGMVYVNLYSAIVANVSNALGTLVPGKQPSFQALFEVAKVLLCAEVVRQRVPIICLNSRAVHSTARYAQTGSVSSPITICILHNIPL